MARQKGIFKIKGTIGDVTFYKSGDGYLVREKGGIDAKRMPATLHFNALVKTVLNLVGRENPGKF